MKNIIKKSFLKQRGAGVLMHITSLPGPAYTGDIGRPAKFFADFLERTKQTVWQLLPLQPTTAEQGFSPYSSSSAMAANPLLINMEWLAERKLLAQSEIAKGDDSAVHADFKTASTYKELLLNKAWSTWNTLQDAESASEFNRFCEEESYWLNDYALYATLKTFFNQMAWYQWPDKYRDRDCATLKAFEEQNEQTIARVKWVQMIFHLQWKELRTYCRERNVRLMGDIPIYVAHDSADVWSNREMFTLNDDGSMSEVSGVPPDIFNDDGQLWGMPLFRWDALKVSGYKWWIDRLKRNRELFDMMRLDHFRGFSGYWAVPAHEKSAKKGSWKKGPGSDLFEAVQRSLGDLALIAEDLGEIDESVYQLRDEWNLPGMNVLQFAFGEDGEPLYLPHNHIQNAVVYSGTHDNNTTIGWFINLPSSTRKIVSDYMGKKINVKNVSEEMCRMAYQSVALLAILPLQDILSLDEASRMNVPSTSEGNWTWRVPAEAFDDALEKKIISWVKLYERDGIRK